MALSEADPAAPASAASPGDGRLMRWFNRRGWSNLIIGTPYVWLVVFFFLPFLIVVAMSFGTRTPTAPASIRSSIWKAMRGCFRTACTSAPF